jgi:hypothetical protein
MKKSILGLLIFGLTTLIYSQTIELKEIEISNTSNYSNATNIELAPLPVQKLEREVIEFIVEDSDSDKNDDTSYSVSFYSPEGKIIADYDNTGNIVKTIEKYKNVRLPLVVLQSIAKRFPNWAVIEDTYLIQYHYQKGITKKLYKITIENVDLTMNIKTDDKGNFI